MLSILTRTLLIPAFKKAKGVTQILPRPGFQPALLKWLLPPLTVACALKACLIAAGVVPFNADEAVVALMARHILQGARPVFFYGQAYMGSLDAWLIAGGFALFGQEVWVIRLVQGFLYLLTLATTAWLGKTALGSWRVGVIAAWFLAIPSVNVTLYTTVSLGGYGEALLIGNLIFLVGLRIVKEIRTRESSIGAYSREPLESGPVRFPGIWLSLITGNLTGLLLLAWGFLVGFGLWSFGLTLVYTLPMGAVMGWSFLRYSRSAKPLALAALGLLLGSSPWWGYALQHGFGPLIVELQGGNIAGVEGLPGLLMVGQHLSSLLLLGASVIFGLRPPWEVRWLGLPLLPFVVIFWLGTLFHAVRSAVSRQPSATGGRPSYFVLRPLSHGRAVLTGLMLAVCLGFILTPFGADPSGRYFLPLAVPLALFAAELVVDLRRKFGPWAWSLVILVLVYNFWGTLECAKRYPPGLTTQFNVVTRVDQDSIETLVAFLREQGETRGYSSYWIAYPLAFLSQEELIYLPRLPYHLDFRYTPRDDRYAPYQEVVARSNHAAFITTHHPELNELLRQEFSRLRVAWQEREIGDFHVFYGLSEKVPPFDANSLWVGSKKVNAGP